MAKFDKFRTLTVSQRRKRYFSEDFKRRRVDELDHKLTTVADICKAYEVSDTAVYKWIYTYSRMRKKTERQVVESDSESVRFNKLQERVKELERIIGQKQILIDFQDKVIELAEEEYNVDIKKKFGEEPLAGTGLTAINTPKK
jgi:transposase-like protein